MSTTPFLVYLLCSLLGQEPLPFSYSLDQGIPCPRGSNQDSSLAYADGGRPIQFGDDREIDQVLSNVSSFLEEKLLQLSCPSAGVIVSQGGRLLRTAWAGSSRVNSTPSSASTSAHPSPSSSSSSSSTFPPRLGMESGFMIASNSKTFAAVTLFQARDLGLLPQGLDTPVSALLPAFAIQPPNNVAASGAAGPLPSKRPITLRALAMQVGGLPREAPESESLPPNATMQQTEDDILRNLAKLTQISQQFTEPHYSNLGLALVGRAIGKAVGKPWEQYLMESVLRPLGMNDTGNPSDYVAGAGARANLIDGVDPDTSLKVPVPVAMVDHWSGPAGSMHSSMRDMLTWMNFLMDVGTPAQRAVFAEVLDPATRAEMRNSGFLMGDGISAIGSGVFETTFTHGRWASNKLGCVSGYRSAMSMVPSLGLAVFGVATSTCDLRGDGDAIAFPVTASLVPAVSRVLADADAKAQAAALPPPQGSILAAIEGQYCSANPDLAMTIAVEQVPLPSSSSSAAWGGPAAAGTAAALVVRPAAGSHGYSFVLEYVGDASAKYGSGATEWRRIMGPEAYLPSSYPGCMPDTGTLGGVGSDDAAAPTKGLCSISCSRKMSRGSGEAVYFYTVTEGTWKGHVRMDDPGGGSYCDKF